MNSAEQEYLRRLLQDAHVVELRHQQGDRWTSGLFNNLTDLDHAIRERAGDGNLFTSLNRPDCLRATNRFNTRALRDDDIGVITRIVFDLDPKRPANTSANDAELRAAVAARGLVVRTLSAYGWPMPALAVSGNGAHAIYRTCLEASPVWRQQSAALYMGLRRLLSEQLTAVEFDTTVRNPARIWRLYGSTNRKGDATPERPHRTAAITLPAGAWQTVKAAVVERTVQALTPVAPRPVVHRGPVNGSGDYSTLDVVAWFGAHGAYRRPLGDGKHAVCCPWSASHTTVSTTGSDSVVWEATNRWPTFHCSHMHCDGRMLRDVLALWGDADAFCARGWEKTHA